MSSEDRSISNVLEDIVGDVQQIIRSEVRLAKTEVQEATARAGKATGILAGGVVMALFALGFLLVAGMFALELVVDAWLAAVIVTAVVGVIASVLVNMGLKRIKRV